MFSLVQDDALEQCYSTCWVTFYNSSRSSSNNSYTLYLHETYAYTAYKYFLVTYIHEKCVGCDSVYFLVHLLCFNTQCMVCRYYECFAFIKRSIAFAPKPSSSSSPPLSSLSHIHSFCDFCPSNEQHNHFNKHTHTS